MADAKNAVKSIDGSIHYFPIDAKPEEMQAALDDYESKIPKADLVTFKQAKSINYDPQKMKADFDAYSAAKKGGSAVDTGVNLARPFTIGPALAAGTRAAEALPLPIQGKALGGAAVAAGTYLGLDRLLQSLMDQKPQSEGEANLSSLGNLAATEGLNAVGKGVASRIKGALNPQPIEGPIGKLAPTYSQIPGVPGARLASKIENIFAPKAKNAAIAESGRLAEAEGNKLAGKMASRSVGTITNPQTTAELIKDQAEYNLDAATEKIGNEREKAFNFLNDLSRSQTGKSFKNLEATDKNGVVELAKRLGVEVPSGEDDLRIFKQNGLRQLINTTDSALPEVDKIINDPKKLQRALTAGKIGEVPSANTSQDLKGYAMNRLLRTSKTNGTLDVDKLMSSWNNPEWKNSKDLLFGKADQENINQLFDAFKQTQQGKPTGSMVKLGLIKGSVYMTPSLITHYLSGPAGMALGSIELGGAALAKAMTNPKTARIMVSAAKGEPLGVSEQYASRVIASVLKGTTVNLWDQKGQSTPAIVEGDSLKPVGQ